VKIEVATLARDVALAQNTKPMVDEIYTMLPTAYRKPALQM
jgi:hypothetical protein